MSLFNVISPHTCLMLLKVQWKLKPNKTCKDKRFDMDPYFENG